MAKKIVSDLNVKGKKVLIRVDFNVPMKNGVITDDTRVRAALPTIQYVVENGGKAIVFSHLGRVKTVEDIAKNNIKPVAARLEELIGRKVIFVDATRGAELEAAVNALQEGEILMFQNTRYEDFDVETGKEVKLESKNNVFREYRCEPNQTFFSLLSICIWLCRCIYSIYHQRDLCGNRIRLFESLSYRINYIQSKLQ